MNLIKTDLPGKLGNISREDMRELFRNFSILHSRLNRTNLNGPPLSSDFLNTMDDRERDAVKTMIFGATLSTLTVIANILLMFIILSSRELRRRPFFWNIFSLCISDLIMGAFVIPIGLDYILNDIWSFGQDLCKVWSITEVCHFSLSACILISICLNRLQTKIQSVTPINPYTARMVSVALVALPWFFLLGVCIPIMVIGERNLSEEFQIQDSCMYNLYEVYHLPSVTVMFVVPAFILFLVVFVMVCVYYIKGTTWDRLQSNVPDTEKAALRVSTMTTWVVSIITFVLWLPYIVLLFIFVTCKDPFCGVAQSTGHTVYSLSLTTSLITPSLWFILPEVRKPIREKLYPIYSKFRTRFRRRETVPANHVEYQTELLQDNDL